MNAHLSAKNTMMPPPARLIIVYLLVTCCCLTIHFDTACSTSSHNDLGGAAAPTKESSRQGVQSQETGDNADGLSHGHGNGDWTANATGAYSAGSSFWLWPTANDPNAENLIHSILSSWCSETYVDAVRDSQSKGAQLDKLRTERDQRYTDWMRCTQERGIKEREMEMECERERALKAAAFEREREKLQGDCDSEANQLKADIENCDVKLKKKGLGLCQKELVAERAECDAEKRGLKDELVACQGSVRKSNVSRVLELEETALRASEERATWAQEKKQLSFDTSECRPRQNKARKRLVEVLTDGRVLELENKLKLLQHLVLGLLVSLGIAGGVLVVQLQKESRVNVEGGHGWIRTMPPSRLQLLDAKSACAQLEETFEKGKGSRLAIVLATDILYGRRRSHTGPNNVFLLVPINITSARRFELFNKNGDYTAHVERAREIVAKSVENPNLLVVLYEAGGCAFTEATLQSLRLTADKVAHEAVPQDVEFPQAENVVVLWLDKQEGLRATDSKQESDEITDNIKLQPWAQYLLMRSGRWGQVHAQFM